MGNWIGTDVTGLHALGNRTGISVDVADNTTIGGSVAGAGNVISGNSGAGVIVDSVDGIVIEGNLIGTDVTGLAALGNGTSASRLTPAEATGLSFAGSCWAGERCKPETSSRPMAPTARSITFYLTGGREQVQGNFFGTDSTGLHPLGNGGFGLLFQGGASTIGGTTAAAGNIIAANLGGGLSVGGSGNLVTGNSIGIDFAGQAMGNKGVGVDFDVNASSLAKNTIGGTAGRGQRDRAQSGLRRLATGCILHDRLLRQCDTGQLDL